MTSDIGSPTWLVTVGLLSDEKWMSVNRWDIVEEKHSKSVMVSRIYGCPGNSESLDITGIIFKNPLLLTLICDEEYTQIIHISNVETGNENSSTRLHFRSGSLAMAVFYKWMFSAS